MTHRSLRRVPAVFATIVLLLSAACGGLPPRSTPPAPTPVPAPRGDAALEARCRAVETAHEWKRSVAPGQPLRSYYTVPAGAPAQLWFSGRNDAVALCTPCIGNSAAVRSFEWYEPGFRKGEMKLLKCDAPAR